MTTLFYYYNPKLERTIYRTYDSDTCTTAMSDISVTELLNTSCKTSKFKTLQSYIDNCCSVNSIPISSVTVLDNFSPEAYPEYFI